MNLSKLENKKIEKMYKMLDETNVSIVNVYKKLMNIENKSYLKLDANAIDFIDVINNEKLQDENLIRLINYRNKIREKFNKIANRIWEQRSAEEVRNDEV